jgi:hypothetical protein
MDVSELRKGILRALDEARRGASAKQAAIDEANTAFKEFLEDIAVPLVRQAAGVLKAERETFVVHTPTDRVRLVAEAFPHTFLEFILDTTGAEPQVLGRVSVTRGRQGQLLEESPIASGKSVAELDENDAARFLLGAIPQLVLKR